MKNVIEMAWNSEVNLENYDTIEIGIEKKFDKFAGLEFDKFNVIAPKPKSPRKRKFKSLYRESAIVEPRDPIPLDESETDLCVALWRSVVIQA